MPISPEAVVLSGWWFDLLLADGIAITSGEPVTENPWMEANYRVVAAVTTHLDGNGQDPLFDISRARVMEKLF